LKTKLAEAVNAGLSRAIIDVSGGQEPEHDDHQAPLPDDADVPRTRDCSSRSWATPRSSRSCKGFEDTRNWSFFESMAEARAFLSNKNAASPGWMATPGRCGPNPPESAPSPDVSDSTR